MSDLTVCPACGGGSFSHQKILWPGLIEEWRLSPEEADYIDQQQGTHCISCHNNLRAMVLARAICRALDRPEPLAEAVQTAATSLQILEINQSGHLTPYLRRMSGYQFAAYPEVDMMNMSYESGMWDLVVHSDTLEHVADPVRALQECRRILKSTGRCCFTVPVIVGRTTRQRTELPPSYHGGAGDERSDYLVHTEFGADMWCWPIRSGFSRVEIDTIAFPAGLALTCRP